MKNIKYLLFISFAFLLASCSATAQPNLQSAQQPQQNVERRNYLEQQVIPVLKQSRQQLDMQLSATDKARIDELRIEQQALRQSAKDNEALRKKIRQDRTQLTEAERQQLRDYMQKRRQIQEQAAEIARNNDANVKAVLEPLKPQAEQWREDLKAMQPEGQTRQRRGNRRGRTSNEGESDRYLMPANFILFDPGASATELSQSMF